MLETRTISIPIEKGYDSVYAFLTEPRNLLSWSSLPQASFRHIAGSEYEAETVLGPALLQFTPANAFGVLDFSMTAKDGRAAQHVAARLLRNGAHCEILCTMFRAEGATPDTFQSEIDWLTAELLVLKSLLESSRL